MGASGSSEGDGQGVRTFVPREERVRNTHSRERERERERARARARVSLLLISIWTINRVATNLISQKVDHNAIDYGLTLIRDPEEVDRSKNRAFSLLNPMMFVNSYLTLEGELWSSLAFQSDNRAFAHTEIMKTIADGRTKQIYFVNSNKWCIFFDSVPGREFTNLGSIIMSSVLKY